MQTTECSISHGMYGDGSRATEVLAEAGRLEAVLQGLESVLWGCMQQDIMRILHREVLEDLEGAVDGLRRI